jgi:6-phospho-beta-glucosidase
VKYQAAHHELIASALATKIAHEVNPENQVGCMLAGGNFYPYSCKPEDVWTALEKDRENLFFIDVQARGTYPAYAARVFREKGVTIEKEARRRDPEKYRRFCVVQLLRLALCLSRNECAKHLGGQHRQILRNPHIQVSEWGWGYPLACVSP